MEDAPMEQEQEQQNPNVKQESEPSSSGSSKPKRPRNEENDESQDLRRSGRAKKPVQRLQVTHAEASGSAPPKPKRAKRGLSRIDEVRLGILHNKTCYVNYVQHPPGPNMIEVRFEDLRSDGSDMSE